ncbi:kinase-like protein [Mollisia scopiformis]|uniref:non-specific serine/threonine protein kinase n=1 Tax=Mollisia scopiformis TaxID=149040 RepID=A0A194XQE6_MOLSC|nr:kinase-like protein [Mollisia scopiformis]KUJ22279.1 kinase-like protein [Mollisia scopiformis]
MDNRLQVRPQETSLVKIKAFEDARKVQAQVIEECKKKGKDPPPYVLEELIGKGSFGRVYRGKDMKTAAIVAVKIIDIDESDTVNPRQADSYSEFLKEVNALRLLSENNAKNINHVLEALPVGKAMWMITEYCGGGSVATLMKPTSPGGLNEKWIIPILREVALALKYVHEVGIIHRDIKCANVLVTEQGSVQLCDFGVAGIVESKMDKRSTIIGTPHWMAPELFNAKTTSYGKEVDIWAFGCMVFELATGSPPFAHQYSVELLGAALQQQTPRLEDTKDSRFSKGLKDLVAFCIQEDPKARPMIEAIQKHPYLINTESNFPASSLRTLVGSFKVWEARGGSRKSLFFQHGAQPDVSSAAPLDEGWNFSTTANFDLEVAHEYGLKDVIDAYGPDAAIGFEEETSRPNQRQPAKVSRRRPPPEALARLPAPLEKIFDPNTMSNYEENSRLHYGGPMQPPPTSDLPLRDDSAQTSIRDTLIDLNVPDLDSGPSTFHDMDTIRANRRVNDGIEDDYGAQDFSRPALSDPADVNSNRQTRDWKFPSMAPPASADPELSRFPPSSWELPRPAVTPGSGSRPTLVHHPTEPIGIGAFGGGLQQSTLPSDRLSMQSLIDLDMSLPDPIPEYRPSTANSDAASTTSETPASANPFELEKQLYQPSVSGGGREPSIYVTEDSSNNYELRNGNTLRDGGDMSDFSASDAEGTAHEAAQYDEDGYYVVKNPPTNGNGTSQVRAPNGDNKAFDSMAMPPPRLPDSQAVPRNAGQYMGDSTYNIPPFPEAPSIATLSGTASQNDVAHEIDRMMNSMSAQLGSFKNIFESTDLIQKRGSMRRDQPKDKVSEE